MGENTSLRFRRDEKGYFKKRISVIRARHPNKTEAKLSGKIFLINKPRSSFVHGIEDPVFTKYKFKHASVNRIVECIRTFHIQQSFIKKQGDLFV